MIRFDPDSFRATLEGDTIRLLPKEFALLAYLCQHAGRSFSREQLLDAVWPLEAPVDRTVDDHIYRLRKKTAAWSRLLRIDTIRGQGYKLTLRDPETGERPLLRDEQFASDVNRLFSKYHSLGMGGAMQLLADNRDALSLPEDPYYDVYLLFIRGDFERLLGTDRIGYWQKAAYAAFVHAFLGQDAAASLVYFERLTREERLSPDWMLDLRLNAVSLYARAGRTAEARCLLDSLGTAVAAMDSPSFTALYLLNGVYVGLREGRTSAAAANLEECGELLERRPIQREKGAYLVAKAMFLYEQGNIEGGRSALDEGLEMTARTRFVPHLLMNLNVALPYLSARGIDEPCRAKLQRQWDALAERYRFADSVVQADKLLALLP